MAKKKSGGSARGKVKAPAKGRTRKAATKGGKGTGGARSQALPGMAKVRNGRLDNLCEAIGEDRQTIARAKADEQGSIQAALREMRDKKIGAYKHAGVELAFVPGEDKLRVRLTKDNADVSTSMAEGAEAGGDDKEEVGNGEEAGESAAGF